PARAVVDGEAAQLRARERAEYVAPILVAAGYQNGVARLLPLCALQEGMARREGARCAFAVNPNVSELGVPLLLHEVVAYLVDEFQLLAEDLSERLGDLLEDDEPVEYREVAARRDGVQVVSVVLRLRREVAEVYVFEQLGVLLARQ